MKMVRIDKNVQQNKLALQLGVAPSYLSRYESGLTAMTMHTFYKYCKVLNVNPSDIWRGIEQRVEKE